MTDTTVVYFDSTMTGAPSLSDTAGALIGVLNACLQDGFGSVTLGSLVVTDNVATATYSNGHGFAMQGNTGPVILIAGATPSGLNGRWRVTVTSTTQFTFATSGISNQTATGTITAKRAPAGFSKTYSGTNKAAYRADAIAGTRLYLRVDDTGTTNARVRGYETMSDIDTGTGLFPTDAQISGGGYVYKSNGASSSPRSWSLYADDRIVYLLCDSANDSTWVGGFVFGDIDSYAPGDAYCCALIASQGESANLCLALLNSSSASYVARSYRQVGSSLASARYSHGKTSSGLGYQGQTYPSPVDNGLHLWPVEAFDSTSVARGLMPGLWNPIHNSDTAHATLFDSVTGLSGITIKTNRTGGTNYCAAFDLTGPWR